jgi:peptidoglycan/xylan/chitin deacetylase (PgdA/CDA1 family)
MDQETFTEIMTRFLQDQRVSDVYAGLLRGSFIRTVNYHSTASINRARFEKQLQFFSQQFTSVTVADIDQFLDSGRWHKPRSGLILAFFEGFRNHYDVIYPLLEKYGLTGWFHIPAFFPDVPIPDQRRFADAHQLHITHAEEYPDGRFAMNWEEIREISQKHVICCHSGTHFRIQLDTSDEDMRREIVEARHHLQAMTGKECAVFCWLYGEEYSYNPRAAVYIQEAGYRYVIGNLKIERVAKSLGSLEKSGDIREPD